MKTAIVIGATSGIGRALALRLAADGWTVGATGRRLERLQALQEDAASPAGIDPKGQPRATAETAGLPAGRIVIRRMDISAPEATEVLDDLISEIGAPNLLLHVSGVGYQNLPLDEAKEIETMKTNCEGMVRIVSHFVNYVRGTSALATRKLETAPSPYTRKHPAQIGVVTSVAGTAGLGIAPGYSASKKMQSTYVSALVQLSRMEKLPVRLSDIRPGFVVTEILNPDKKYPFAITAEKAAGYILRGIRRRRRIITFDWKFRIISALWRLIPRGIWERITIVRN